MTPELLIRCQNLLYGEQGGPLLAEALGCSYRTLQRWKAGQNAIPDGLGAELEAILRARAGEALSLAEECADDAVRAS